MIKRLRPWALIAVIVLALSLFQARVAVFSDRAETQTSNRQSLEPHFRSNYNTIQPWQFAELQKGFRQCPIYFEINQGQAAAGVEFIARGSGVTTFLTATEAVFSFPIARDSRESVKTDASSIHEPENPTFTGMMPAGGGLRSGELGLGTLDSRLLPSPFQSGRSQLDNRQSSIRMKFLASNPNAQIEGLDRLPGISNYFIGSDPKKWRTNIPHYDKVRYREVYPGIDLVYYTNQGNLEYDLVVRPQAELAAIQIAFEGAEKIEEDPAGDLVLYLSGGEIRQHKPRAYQDVKGEKREIAVDYVVAGNGRVTFKVGNYALAQALVIDPVLRYSTYLGGGSVDQAWGVAVDNAGSVYLTGTTSSVDFPTTSGAFRSTYSNTTCGSGQFARPCQDMFVTKLNPAGDALVYSTYLGGNISVPNGAIDSFGSSITVDSIGSAVVSGFTQARDFPTVNPLQPSSAGDRDGVVLKLNPSGSALVYSTYVGGTGFDYLSGICLDAPGNAYLTGSISSRNSSIPNPWQPTFGAETGSFIAKLSPTGTAVLYFATIAGAGLVDVAVDSLGNAYATGRATMDFQPVNPLQLLFGGGDRDAVVAKLNPPGTALVYATFLGGRRADAGYTVAVDSAGDAYVAGTTESDDFPVTNQAFEKTYGGSGEFKTNNFVAKIKSNGTELMYSTYLQTNLWVAEGIIDIAVDHSGQAHVAGTVSSPDFPTVQAIQPFFGGTISDPLDLRTFDAFAAVLNPQGSSLVYSTFLGGTGADSAYAIAIDSSGNTYVVGSTWSSDFPTFGPQISPYKGPTSGLANGPGDVFVVKLAPGDNIQQLPAGVSFDSAGGTSSVNVMGPTNFSWTAVSQASWITVNPPATGTGNGVVSYSVAPSVPGEVHRSGKLIIAGRVVTITQGTDLFVPVVLSAAGINNSFFTSELTLTNRGKYDATLHFSYRGSSEVGGGGGTASDTLEAGRQRIVPDAIGYLKSLGITIPDSGGRFGTLAVRISGADAATISATVRTTTAVAGGRAGLAYSGLRPSMLLNGPATLTGLRQNVTDRSNVALQHAGTPADGDITLRLTIFAGDRTGAKASWLETLSPGEFRQITEILARDGINLGQGFVRVERVAGVSPYYAYAVLNDQVTSDGSFIWPRSDTSIDYDSSFLLPVMVETKAFTSELIMANWSNETRSVLLQYSADVDRGKYAVYQMDLRPNEQIIIPNFVQFLRDRQVDAVQEIAEYVGQLFVSPRVGFGNAGYFIRSSDVAVGARTSTAGSGGRYGLFYGPVPVKNPSKSSVWIFGLQQSAETRSNLALVSLTGGIQGANTYRIDLFDGDTGTKASTIENVTLFGERWFQLNSILATYAPGVRQGYARITPTSLENRFTAYAVINDGGAPGERTGDGAFIASSP